MAAAALVAVALVGWGIVAAGTHAPPVFSRRAPAIPGRLFANATGEGRSIRWIAVGSRPVAALVSPDEARVYVSNLESGTVSVIDASHDTVISTIGVGGQPGAMAATPDGRRLYVANVSGYVSEIDLADDTVRTISAEGPVSDLALDASGRRLFLATGFHGLHELSLPDRGLAAISTTAAPMYLAAVPGASRLYVNYQAGGPGGRPGHDAIDFLDWRSGELAGAIAGAPNVGGSIAAAPDASQIWANGEDACTSPAYDHAGCPMVPGSVVNVVRPSDNRIIRTLGFPENHVNAISFFPDASRAVLASPQRLRVVDTTSFATTEMLELGDAGKIAFRMDGRRAWCPVRGRNAVAVFDLDAKGCAPPPPGLIGWWTGDGIAENLSAARISFAPGLVGQAFELDGGVPLTIGPPGYGVSHREMTVAAWVKPPAAGTSAAEMALLAFTDDRSEPDRLPGWAVSRTGDGRLRLCAANSVPWGGCESVPETVARGVLAAGVWAHVAVSRSADEVAVYLNGELQNRIPAAQLAPADGVRLHVGARGGSMNGFRGLVDEIQWFDRALSPSEVRSMVKAGSAGVCRSAT